MYNYMSRDVTASVGYDYVFRQVGSATANKLFFLSKMYVTYEGMCRLVFQLLFNVLTH